MGGLAGFVGAKMCKLLDETAAKQAVSSDSKTVLVRMSQTVVLSICSNGTLKLVLSVVMALGINVSHEWAAHEASTSACSSA
eukprot:3906805-Amphidinium_carterae.1